MPGGAAAFIYDICVEATRQYQPIRALGVDVRDDDREE